jgi:phosphoglycerate kinase
MAVQNPPRPFYAVLGGAKVADKIPVIENLLEKVDGIVIGGGMSFTFLKAQGVKIGRSLLDKESEGKSAEFLKRAREKGVDFLLPADSLVIDGDLSAYKERRYVDFPEPGVPDGWLGPDIGPKTMAAFCEALGKAKCVVWNGPMGVFEQPAFACGTYVLAVALAGATAAGCVTILGGGDTGAAAKEFGLEGSFSHISTGGGASLEFLGGDVLPGIAALPDQG